MTEKKKLTYHVYHPEKPDPEDFEMEWTGDFEEVRAVVNTLVQGNLEHVAVLFNSKRSDMFVESRSSERFAPNKAATDIYHASSLSRDPKADTSTWPRIYGVAVVFDQIVWT